jgi:hypothetical protein
VVAQPLRRAETLALYSGSCVAPLRLGGLRGKQSTPSVWLGGTGEHSAVGKRERQGAASFFLSSVTSLKLDLCVEVTVILRNTSAHFFFQ